MPAIVDHLLIVGRRLRVEWHDAEVRRGVMPALRHRLVAAGDPAFVITVTSGRQEWPAETADGFFIKEEGSRLWIRDAAHRVVTMIDPEAGRAEVDYPGDRPLPVLERAAPFRLVFQHWLQRWGAGMLHAGAVGMPGVGAVLLVARSGGGKSSTVLACLDSPLMLLGEDLIALDGGRQPVVWSLYSSVKVHPHALAQFAGSDDVADPTPDPVDEKILLQLGTRHLTRFADGLPLRALFILEISHRPDTRLVPAPAGEALKEMLTSLLMVVPSTRRPLFVFAAQLARQHPVYRLELGTIPCQIPRTIQDFLLHADHD